MFINNFFNIVFFSVRFIFFLLIFKVNIDSKISQNELKINSFYLNYFFKKNNGYYFLNKFLKFKPNRAILLLLFFNNSDTTNNFRECNNNSK